MSLLTGIPTLNARLIRYTPSKRTRHRASIRRSLRRPRESCSLEGSDVIEMVRGDWRGIGLLDMRISVLSSIPTLVTRIYVSIVTDQACRFDFVL